MVEMEVRYYHPDAKVVNFVWGFNGWTVLEGWPTNSTTVVRNNIMYSPMIFTGEYFSVMLVSPKGATIDYAFQVVKNSKNEMINQWDTNDGSDYQTKVSEPDNIEIYYQHEKPEIRGAINKLDKAVVQKIYYQAPEAGEVTLVWGIDEWRLPPESYVQKSTEIIDSLMHTAMTKSDDVFSAEIKVPHGSVLSYGFAITKKVNGGKTYVWDAGVGELSSFNKDESFYVKSTVSLEQAIKLPMYIENGGVILLFSLFWYVMAYVSYIRSDKRISNKKSSSMVKIICTSISLVIFVWFVRLKIAGYEWISPEASVFFIAEFLTVLFYDFIFIFLLAIAFLCFIFFAKKKQRKEEGLLTSYYLLALITLSLSYFNNLIVVELGEPFTYAWLYYSDFLGSIEAKSSVFSKLTYDRVINLIYICLSMLIVSKTLYILTIIVSPAIKRVTGFVVASMVMLYIPLAHSYIKEGQWEYEKLANPVVYFFESILDASPNTSLFSKKISDEIKESLVSAHDSSKGQSEQTLANRNIQNVIVVVMESVSTKYLDVYGGQYSVTPNLSKYLKHSIVFENIYAHAPASNKALVSLLASIYPNIAYYTITRDHPKIKIPTLSGELSNKGYRAVFLNAADNRFQKTDEFLEGRGFTKVGDQKSINCSLGSFEVESDTFLDGLNEYCLIEEFMSWQQEKPSEPFFSMMWTASTHHPYFVFGDEVDYGVPEDFNRYLNAIRHTDDVIGHLIESLIDKNLFDSTLVVVVGDHGEAFGQHDNYGHATSIYEENIHVPLIFINPGLLESDKSKVVGGLIDVAPTIFDFIKLTSPKGWQGKSLFSDDRDGKTYFFSPWYDYQFGYRTDNLKLIYNATKDTYELFDLQVDPNEKVNLSNNFPNQLNLGYDQLSGWVQYHQDFIQRQLEN